MSSLDLLSSIKTLLVINEQNIDKIKLIQSVAGEIEQASQIEEFYKIPLKFLSHILQIATDITPSTAGRILYNYSKVNSEQAPLLLNDISVPKASFDETCIIISSLYCAPLCFQLGEIRPRDNEVDFDWEYELSRRENEISDLKKLLVNENLPLPLNYEPNIFKACLSGNFESVKYMVLKKHDTEVTDDEGNTPLIIALASGKLEIAKLLVENEADIEHSDSNGNTPLMIAAASGYVGEVQYLISKGAQVDVCNDYGNTALHFASVMNECAIARLLLSNGADKGKRDNNSKTAYDWARKDEMKSIVQ